MGGSVLPLYFKGYCVIVALSGKKRSGKDEFYRVSKSYLEAFYGIPVTRYAFADKVKEYASLYFNVDTANETDKEKTRFVLQGIGQMLREEVEKDYWLNVIRDEIARDNEKYGEFGFVGFITDTRYRNEADWVVNNGYPFLRIIRRGIIADDPHPSEMELDDFVFENVFQNMGTYEEYRESVREWVNQNILTSLSL